MSILHILKTKPDDNTQILMSAFAGNLGEDAAIYELFDEHVDYEELIDLIFEHEKVVSWW